MPFTFLKLLYYSRSSAIAFYRSSSLIQHRFDALLPLFQLALEGIDKINGIVQLRQSDVIEQRGVVVTLLDEILDVALELTLDSCVEVSGGPKFLVLGHFRCSSTRGEVLTFATGC